jgi:hypothetical protein
VFDRIDFVAREQIQKREKDNADVPNSRFRHERAHAGTSQSNSLMKCLATLIAQLTVWQLMGAAHREISFPIGSSGQK